MNSDTKAKYQNAYAKGEKGFKEYSKTPEWMTNTWKLIKGSDEAKAAEQPKEPKPSNR